MPSKRTLFQFTHPGRGATYIFETPAAREQVSIHAPREGCDRIRPRDAPPLPCFNSRTPGGVRQSGSPVSPVGAEFQFTHPGRGATPPNYPDLTRQIVSIHAPREGCDVVTLCSPCCRECFNSRTPGGVRLRMYTQESGCGMFQFTPPGRGATALLTLVNLRFRVSIHAPREGCD